jgi:uncharacterized protein
VDKVQINVSQQLKASIGEVRRYEINGTVAIEDSDIDVSGKVKLTRTDNGILVEGKLVSVINLTCGRCLNEFRHDLNLIIEEIFYPTTDIHTGVAISVPDEPGCFTIDENNILDLTDAVSQYALMTIPIKPLCRQDCAGLCPVCGTNLNTDSCDCPSATADPRWDGLRKLVTIDSEEPVKDRKGS